MKYSASQHNGQPWIWVILVLTVVFCAAGLSSGLTLVEKTILGRYLLMAFAGLLAFATPWLLFPQVPVFLTQMLNPNAAKITWILERRIRKVWVGALLFSGTFLYYGSDRTDLLPLLYLFGEHILSITAVTLFATYRYLLVGPLSQKWQEGQAGQKVIQNLRDAGQSTGVPPGSLPTLGTTISVTVIGMLSIVLGAWLQAEFKLQTSALGVVLLLIWGVFGWMKTFSVLDVHFYQSHAFYSELFRNPGGKADGGRNPLPIEALYWVPPQVKPLVWSTLRQMDRKVPVGRLVMGGLILYASLLYAGMTNVQIVTFFPLAVILIKNMMIYRLTAPAFAPRKFQYHMGGLWTWFWARLFVNLRWTLPILLFLGLITWASSALSAEIWYYWSVTEVALAFVTAITASIRLESRIPYDYA